MLRKIISIHELKLAIVCLSSVLYFDRYNHKPFYEFSECLRVYECPTFGHTDETHYPASDPEPDNDEELYPSSEDEEDILLQVRNVVLRRILILRFFCVLQN